MSSTRSEAVSVSNPLTVTVNGDPVVVSSPCTIDVLIQTLGFTDGPVAVECNGVVVPRLRHSETLLTNGDCVELVHFVGGG